MNDEVYEDEDENKWLYKNFACLLLKIEVEFMQKVRTVGIFVEKYTQDICVQIRSSAN